MSRLPRRVRALKKPTTCWALTFSSVMFEGTDEALKQTAVTQPAIFLHSVILAECMGEAFHPDMVAGHSLGEFSALVAAGSLNFAEGLKLVSARANAMQKACEAQPSTMAAVLGLGNDVVERICLETTGVVVAANYNCPGQLVISGEVPAVEAACPAMSRRRRTSRPDVACGRCVPQPFDGARACRIGRGDRACRHSSPSLSDLSKRSAEPTTDPGLIRQQLVAQLTAPVRWTQTMQTMIADGASEVTEVGPGKVLQGLFKKVDRAFPTTSAALETA